MKTGDGQSGIDSRLRTGHRERLRQRMSREGWDALRPSEMVELVLYHAGPRQDLSGVSRRLVDQFETVGGVFNASEAALLTVPGVTPRIAGWILLTGALMRAYRDEQGAGSLRLSCRREVTALLDFLGPVRGKIRVLYADYNYNFITWMEEDVCETWWEAPVVRRMMTEAIGNGARYLYLVIPDREARRAMSQEDRQHLSAVETALNAAELVLVDCLLEEREGFFSVKKDEIPVNTSEI
ncbi:MAG: hypothetical protein IJH38_01945 [Clostridia bacterium]|nr:hypothetical protein [Clostridia bacterium]